MKLYKLACLFSIIGAIIVMSGCKEELAIPTVQEGRLLFSSKSDTLSAGKFTFYIPEGAISSDAEIVIEEEVNCNFIHPTDTIYFFKCPFSFGPADLPFSVPVGIAVTEDKYWLRAVNELGLVQDFPVNSLRLYAIDIISGKATQLPDATVQEQGSKVTISGKINRLGTYQIGVPRDAIQFLGGKMEAILTGELSRIVTIENNRTGSGGALQRKQYLSNKLITTIALFSDPSKPLESNSIQIITSATSTGHYDFVNRDGENASVAVFFEDDKKFEVRPLDGEKVVVHISKYEKVGGVVEGFYETRGKVFPGEQLVTMHITFKVRRVT